MNALPIFKASLLFMLAFLVSCSPVQQPYKEVNTTHQQLAQSGSVTAWSGGRKAWGGGRKAWGGGNHVADPSGAVLGENAAIWDKLSLKVAHQVLAKNMGKDVIVAVIDTGIDHRHPIFINRLAARNTWYDYVGLDSNPQEVNGPAYGHGTVVASIVLQIAPEAKIMPLRVLGPDGSGRVEDVAAAINRAINRGAKVIQLSLGTEEFSPSIATAIKRASNLGVYVVASAGNNNANPTYPAFDAMLDTSVGRISVGVGSVDINDLKSSFSNFLPEDGVIGDGLEMVSFGEQVYGAIPGSRIAYWDGTSMAAPMVAGALALAIAEGAEALSPRQLAIEVIESSLEIDTDGTVNGQPYELEQRLEIGLFLCNALNLTVIECQQAFLDADDADDDNDDDD